MPPLHLLPISSGYLTRSRREHVILHPPKEILEVFHQVSIMQPVIRHFLEGMYDSQCIRTIYGMILINNDLLIRRPRRRCLNNLRIWD